MEMATPSIPYSEFVLFTLKRRLQSPPMRVDPQETLTNHNKTRNVQYPIRGQIMQLQLIREEQPTDEREEKSHEERNSGSIHDHQGEARLPPLPKESEQHPPPQAHRP